MAGQILNYFAGGNTAKGFYHFFESNLQGLNRVFILKGGPGTGKSTLMKKIGDEWEKKGFDLEYMRCSADPQSLDGIVIKDLLVGIVDGTAPHIIEPKAPGAIEDYVNLGEAWNSRKLANDKEKILTISEQISQQYQTAYALFAEALQIHDEWEQFYIANMDFEKANELTVQLLEEIFAGIQMNKTSHMKHRFLGAATPEGAVDFIPNITSGLHKRYFIKGRPGSGKSTMLKKIAAHAQQLGCDVEMYHCGFDPDSIDMIIMRELGVALFDSTPPHEYFPERKTDMLVDTYARTILPDTDEKYASEIRKIKERYSWKMKEATTHLAKAKKLHAHLEEIYKSAIDFQIINKQYEMIRKEILEIENVANKK